MRIAARVRGCDASVCRRLAPPHGRRTTIGRSRRSRRSAPSFLANRGGRGHKAARARGKVSATGARPARRVGSEGRGAHGATEAEDVDAERSSIGAGVETIESNESGLRGAPRGGGCALEVAAGRSHADAFFVPPRARPGARAVGRPRPFDRRKATARCGRKVRVHSGWKEQVQRMRRAERPQTSIERPRPRAVCLLPGGPPRPCPRYPPPAAPCPCRASRRSQERHPACPRVYHTSLVAGYASLRAFFSISRGPVRPVQRAFASARAGVFAGKERERPRPDGSSGRRGFEWRTTPLAAKIPFEGGSSRSGTAAHAREPRVSMARGDQSPRAPAAPGGFAGAAGSTGGEESRLLALERDESRELASATEVIEMPRPAAPIGAYVMLAAAVCAWRGGRGGGEVCGVPPARAAVPSSRAAWDAADREGTPEGAARDASAPRVAAREAREGRGAEGRRRIGHEGCAARVRRRLLSDGGGHRAEWSSPGGPGRRGKRGAALNERRLCPAVDRAELRPLCSRLWSTCVRSPFLFRSRSSRFPRRVRRSSSCRTSRC